jgi:hypothetical protein
MSDDNIQTPVPNSNDIFAEAFAAATGSNTSEEVEATDIQDIPSGTEVVEATEDNSEPNDLETSSEDSGVLSENIEEIAVKGKDGKRKNIKVDFSNKAQLKKYVQKAANAVRLQSERDALQAKVGGLEEASNAMNNLQSIVDTKGFEGLIDHLNSDNGGFQAWMDTKLSRHETRLHANEDELAKLDAEDKAAELQRRLDLIEKQSQDREARGEEERNAAVLDRLASEVNPIYFKYTFDGKLGDSIAEARHNKAMFREVTETLDSLKSEGVKISPAVIEREFRSYAQPLLKGVNRKVRQNTKSAIDKKKAEATSHAQQQVRKGYDKNPTQSTGHWVKDTMNDWLKGKL